MLIILDRDGVINQDSPDYIKSPAEWIPIAGSLEAIAALTQHGHRIVVATNQSGIARGYYDLATLAAIHQKMQNEVQKYGGLIDDIFFCPHGPKDNCNCRKPRPGLMEQIAEKYQVDFTNAWAIGDSYRDIQAAQAVNCPAILVKTGNGADTLMQHSELHNIPHFDNLAAAVKFILTTVS